MTATQSLNLYNISLRYFKNEADASSFVKEIEFVVDNKFTTERNILATKDDLVGIRKEIADSKLDLIKWMVGMWVAQMAAIVFLIIRK
ncbi:MAG: hypothetical protein ABI378_10145 [Chitinophagaceae bacterium]